MLGNIKEQMCHIVHTCWIFQVEFTEQPVWVVMTTRLLLNALKKGVGVTIPQLNRTQCSYSHHLCAKRNASRRDTTWWQHFGRICHCNMMTLHFMHNVVLYWICDGRKVSNKLPFLLRFSELYRFLPFVLYCSKCCVTFTESHATVRGRDRDMLYLFFLLSNALTGSSQSLIYHSDILLMAQEADPQSAPRGVSKHHKWADCGRSLEWPSGNELSGHLSDGIRWVWLDSTKMAEWLNHFSTGSTDLHAAVKTFFLLLLFQFFSIA